MPDLVTGGFVGCSATYGWWKLIEEPRRARRRHRYHAVARLYQECFRADFSSQSQSRTRITTSNLVGADLNAKMALTVVQDWEDKHPEPEDAAWPTCSAGLVSFSCGPSAAEVPHLETAVCAELKSWLLSAAAASSSASSAADVAQRLSFYDRLLMRPELFQEPTFIRMLAQVCEQLNAMGQRLSAKLQTCAGELQKIVSAGREFVDCVLPVLLFALTDPNVAVEFSQVTTEILMISALKAARCRPGDREALWEREFGEMLMRFLLSEHALLVWNPKEAGDGVRNHPGKLHDRWPEMKHRWIDPPGSGSLDRSGLYTELCKLDTTEETPVQLSWLELVRHLDDFVQFLAVVMRYHQLATIAGDAGMHFLRSGLHHLIQEVENSLSQAAQAAFQIDDAAKRNVTEFALAAEPRSSRLTWTQRLQRIDMIAAFRHQRAVMASIHELRCLSSPAALPALEGAFLRNLQQLSALMQSDDFKQHCAVKDGLPLTLAEEVQALAYVREAENAAQSTAVLIEEQEEQEQKEEQQQQQEQQQPIPAIEQPKPTEPAPDSAGREASVVEEEAFYDSFFMAVAMPYFQPDDDDGDEDFATLAQVQALLQRADLPSEVVEEIVRVETNENNAGDAEGTKFTWDRVRHICQLVAHAQRGCRNLYAVKDESPGRLPRFHGLRWEAGKLSVLEPLLEPGID